jgi:AraC family transcriptional regulator, regulatory protein of adaptative response / methylated-DNA-[protein]-cysteine methyltransferase
MSSRLQILEGKELNLAMKPKGSNGQMSEEERWHAVLSRDVRFDGEFVFAVASTGIYCRPSCPSRRPHRERVTFFTLPEAAEQAGYRACLRCHPKRARSVDPQIEMVQRLCRYLESTDFEKGKLSDLARHVGVSTFHLQRTFKSVMGISPRQYAAAHRFGSFKSRVREGETITNALYDSGFNSSSRLYESAADELGMTPATYGRGGRGTKIAYTTVESPLGRLLVAVTERGICAVRMADTDEQLERDLKAEFPAAMISRADTPLRETVKLVLDHLANKEPALDLPLDVRATAFQRQVWEQLKLIPFGETRSYKAIAEALGSPGSVRAVGGACATNPVALLIPCHRVVRQDQSLGGYRWGLTRKRKLLELERSLLKKA